MRVWARCAQRVQGRALAFLFKILKTRQGALPLTPTGRVTRSVLSHDAPRPTFLAGSLLHLFADNPRGAGWIFLMRQMPQPRLHHQHRTWHHAYNLLSHLGRHRAIILAHDQHQPIP